MNDRNCGLAAESASDNERRSGAPSPGETRKAAENEEEWIGHAEEKKMAESP